MSNTLLATAVIVALAAAAPIGASPPRSSTAQATTTRHTYSIKGSFTGSYRSGSWKAAAGTQRISLRVTCAEGQQVTVALYRVRTDRTPRVGNPGAMSCNDSARFGWRTAAGRYFYTIRIDDAALRVQYKGTRFRP
ncbi:hypothetical protein [Spirillospora sp. NPDC047279]|uniref:hypothetical protein n=1 Tax=Spirillospora sp. NPDC047279 TaxID=3155478 RepID=UPI0033C2558B